LALGEALTHEIEAHDSKFSESEFEFGHQQSPAMFEAARKYCALHATASCLHTWVSNRAAGSSFFTKGRWLAPAMARILRKYVNIREDEDRYAYQSEVLEELRRLHGDNRMFSIRASALGNS
jgi:hypothetical protein